MVTKVFPTRNFTAVNYFDTTKIITTVIWNTDNNILSISPHHHRWRYNITPQHLFHSIDDCVYLEQNICVWLEQSSRVEISEVTTCEIGCEIVPLENKFPPVSVLECDQVGFCAWIVPGTIPADLAAVGRLPSAANRILRASIPRSGKQW